MWKTLACSILGLLMIGVGASAQTPDEREERGVYVTTMGAFGGCTVVNPLTAPDAGQTCFDLLPGETSVSVEIQDEAIGNVAGKLTFWTVDGPMTGDGTTYFCNAAQVAVPPGADHFVVKLVGGFVDLVDPKVIPGDCGTTLHNYATRGEVVATFA